MSVVGHGTTGPVRRPPRAGRPDGRSSRLARLGEGVYSRAMTTPAHANARRPHLLTLALGAASLAALLPVGRAQIGATGDVRLVLTGGEHAGEYVLTDVPLFMCAFGLPGPGWFSVQYFAEDVTAWPSSIQAAHTEPDAAEVDTPDLVIGFGDLAEDGAGYMIWESRDQGSLETSVVDEGDTATLTLEGTDPGGVGISLEVVCRNVYRFQGGAG